MTATLLLARHGETDPNREGRVQGGGIDAPLNATGRAQAQRLAQALRHEPLRAVYASPLRRARQTAEVVAAAHGLDVTTVPELAEMRFGAFEGRSHAEPDVAAALAEVYARWAAGDLDHAVPGGESPRAVAARAVPALERLAAAHPGETVFVVTHGRLLRIVLATVLPGHDPAAMHAITHTNGSLYRLRHTCGRGFVADYLDQRAHLADV